MLAISKEFQQELYNGNRDYLLYVDVTLKDGTVLNFTNDEIWENSFKIEDSTSDINGLNFGSAIINKFTVTIENINDQYSMYYFEGAEVSASIGLKLSSGEIEKLKKGVYTVDEATYDGVTITLECLDRMVFLDRKYDSPLSYPATLIQILYDACKRCNVPLKTTDFRNSSYLVAARPSDEEITYREIISYIAQFAGSYARFDNEGYLEFKWYDKKVFEFTSLDGGDFKTYKMENVIDGGAFTYVASEVIDGGDFEDSNSYHHLYANSSVKVGIDEIVITGVKVITNDSDETISSMIGKNGYVLVIENNPFAKTKEDVLAHWAGEKTLGMRFRPFEVQGLDDPSVEAGDPVMISDIKGNVYYSYVTSLTFQVGSYETFSCQAQTTSENESVRYNVITKNIMALKKEINQKISNYEYEFNNFNDLLSNAMGFYQTKEIDNQGKTIIYLHNKEKLEGSKTIWKISIDGFAVSLDGGKTWTTGITKEGNIIASILSVHGINADWITTGSIASENYTEVQEEIGSDYYTRVTDGMSINLISGAIKSNGFVTEDGDIRAMNHIWLDGQKGKFLKGFYWGDAGIGQQLKKYVYQIAGISNYNNLVIGYPETYEAEALQVNMYCSLLNLMGKSGTDVESRPGIKCGNIECNKISCKSINSDSHVHETETIKATISEDEQDALGLTPTQLNFSNTYAPKTAYVKRIATKVASINTSDLRLKKDLKRLSNIENIYLNLKPYNYRFKSQSEFYNQKIHSGVIAQEVIKLFERQGIDWQDYDLIEMFKPDVKLTDEGQYVGEQGYRVNYNNLHAWHIYMIQQQQKQIDSLQEENRLLKDRLDKIEKLILEKSEVNF